MTAKAVGLAAVVVGGLASGACGSDASTAADRPAATAMSTTTIRTTTTVAPTRRPRTAAELGALLDGPGRPYDVADEGLDRHEVERERIGPFVAPKGTVRVVAGEALLSGPQFEDTDQVVSFAPADRLDLSVYWEKDVPTGQRQILGVRLDVPGTVVARWDAFTLGYGTDGGMGGLAAGSLVDRAEQLQADRTGDGQLVLDALAADGLYLADLDAAAGTDLLIFENGMGDGAFPKVVGRDGRDRVVSLVVWDPRYPWRLAIPEGVPPRDVTERETEIQECLDGSRGVDQWGSCVSG